MGIMLTPIRCPKCGHWVNFTYFNTAGQHWVCPECGNNSENQKYIYGTTIKQKKEIQKRLMKEEL